MARDDRRQGAEDRPAAPDLHGGARARLRAGGPAGLATPFRVTVHRGPAVERHTARDLAAALDLVEAAARAASREERPGSVDLRFRTFGPQERVVARVELAGPQRLAPSVRAGIDVRGDGSMTAHTGRARRAPVAEREDETALQALRRVLDGAGS